MEQSVRNLHDRLKSNSHLVNCTQTVEGFNVGTTAVKCPLHHKHEARPFTREICILISTVTTLSDDDTTLDLRDFKPQTRKSMF